MLRDNCKLTKKVAIYDTKHFTALKVQTKSNIETKILINNISTRDVIPGDVT